MKIPWKTTLALVGVIVGVFPATPVSSAPPNGPQVHQLRGTSVFTASQTSSTLVRFPRAVDFLEEFRPSYEGNGRVTGFIMRKQGRYEQEGYRPVIESATIGQCKKRGCEGRDADFSFTVCFCNSRELTGTWELYVLADGAPVTVTFKSKPLDGRSTASVMQRAAAEIKTLDPRVQESTTKTLFSAGDYTRLKEADFGLVGLWVTGAPHAATAIGDCLYYDNGDYGYPSVAPPEEAAFLPGCPTGEGSAYPYVDQNGGGGGMIFTSASFCCPVGLGGWYTTAADVKRYGAVAFWIDF
ncbi:MAG: hypothetical protein M3238_00180 [Actinomycetota bacterium]|nr:hypothetical protein [Actinomycetota bacterium]